MAQSQVDQLASEVSEIKLTGEHYGTRPLNQSQGPAPPSLLLSALEGSLPVRVRDINSSLADKCIWVRGRLHNSRSKGLFRKLFLKFCNKFLSELFYSNSRKVLLSCSSSATLDYTRNR